MRRAVLALCALACLGCRGGDEGPRHLLLVTLDTVRADRVGYAGGRPGVTPRLDALAAEGAAFLDCWAPRGQTWPALASLWTGELPLVHGVRENGLALPPGTPTVAAAFRAGGFRTGAFLANSCEAWGLDTFDTLVCGRSAEETAGDQARLQSVWDERVVDAALEWMELSEQPSLSWVHLYDAHKPWPTVAPYGERFLDPAYRGALRAEPGAVANGHDMPYHQRVDALALQGAPPQGADREALLATYDGGLAAVDAQLGRLLDALERSGRLEDTLVVVSSDHGEELYDHLAYPYHGAALHGSTLRVPLVFWHPPRVPAGLRVSSGVELIDLAPTLLSIFDLPAPIDFPGRDLSATFVEGAQLAPASDALSEVVQLTHSGGRVQLGQSAYALRRGRWRLIWNPERVAIQKAPFEGAHPGLVHESALYDLEVDPAETRDVSAEHPELVEELAAALEARVAALARRARSAAPPDPAVLETLSNLGYGGGASED